MAAPTVNGTPTRFEDNNTTTTATIPVPTGVVAGELLVVHLAHSNQTAPSVPGGWTTIATRNGFDASSPSSMMCYRVASGSEPANYTFTVVSGRTTGEMFRVGGAHATTPIDVTAATANLGTSTTFDTPSITTVTNEALVLAGIVVNASASADIVTPSGWTQVVNSTGTGRRAAVFSKVQTTAGATGIQTWSNTPATSLQWDGIVVAIRPAAGGAPTATLVHRMVGISTTSTVRVNTRTSNAASVRLKVGTDAAVTANVSFSSSATPDAQGNAKLTVSGLNPGTQYYYRVAMTPSGGSEALDTAATVGRVKTAPSGQASFSFCFASCTNSTDSTAMAAIAARGDDLFLHVGDLYYADGTGTGVQNFRDKVNAKIETTNHAAVFATTPTAYTPSDHDGMNNNANAGSDPTAWTNWNQVYRELIPTPTLPGGTTGCYYAFSWGRVRFVVLDTRSFASNPAATDNSSKTRLGSAQKTWFKNEVTSLVEPVMVVVQADPWVGAASAGDDGWFGFVTERTELANHISASGKQVVLLAGDMHAVAADNGTNAPGGVTVFQAAPLNNNASQKGGPYSAGVYPSSGTTVVQQYGRVVVTDSGSQIALAFTGYSADNTARVSLTKTVAVSGLQPPTGLTATPVSPNQVNLSWTAASGATGYDIERDGVVIVTGQAATTYSDTGRSPSTTYTYRVRSVS